MVNEVYGDIKPLRNKVIVRDIEKGQQVTRGGIILPDDDGKDWGIRPRWAKVYKVGSEKASIFGKSRIKCGFDTYVGLILIYILIYLYIDNLYQYICIY